MKKTQHVAKISRRVTVLTNDITGFLQRLFSHLDNGQTLNAEVVDWRMVGLGLVFRVEARLRNEKWRKVCVRKSSSAINHIATDEYTSYYYSELNNTLCASADTIPNDTSINEVLVAELRLEKKFQQQNGIQLLRLQNATDCSEVAGLINLNVYCLGYGKFSKW